MTFLSKMQLIILTGVLESNEGHEPCLWQKSQKACFEREREGNEIIVGSLPSGSKVDNEEDNSFLPPTRATFSRLSRFRSILPLPADCPDISKALVINVKAVYARLKKIATQYYSLGNVFSLYGYPRKVLGNGSFGTVYLFEKGAEKFAIKWTKVTSKRSLKFIGNEFACTQCLSNQYVCRTLDVLVSDEDNCHIILVQEFFEGCDLLDLFVQNPTFMNDLYKASVVVQNILTAVVHCFNSSICHNDLKPENIMINTDTLEIRIVDFGLAIKADMPNTFDNRYDVYRNGTQGYMLVPCCDTGEFDTPFLKDITIRRIAEAKEIFALGCVLYNVFTNGACLFDTCDRRDVTFCELLKRKPLTKLIQLRQTSTTSPYLRFISTLIERMTELRETDRINFYGLEALAKEGLKDNCTSIFDHEELAQALKNKRVMR